MLDQQSDQPEKRPRGRPRKVRPAAEVEPAPKAKREYKKRGNGEGSIFERDGKYIAQITVGTRANGSPQTVQRSADTRPEAAKLLQRLQRELADGQRPGADRERLDTFLDTWLEEAVKGSVRPATYESYVNMVRLHIAPSSIGRKKIGDLTAQEVQKFLRELGAKKAANKETPLSPRTVQYARAILRRALRYGQAMGYLGRNVATLIVPPSVPKPKIKVWSPEEARLFLAATRDDRLYALYSVALSLGLRRGEALALVWSDIDLKRGHLTIGHSLRRTAGKLVRRETKSEDSQRTIVIPPPLLLTLHQHRAIQEEERQAAGARWQDNDLVFPSSIGTPLEPRNAIRLFAEAVKRAGLPHTRFHDLRHTCATLLLVQGVHPRVVMEILGHSNISTTLNIYSHVPMELQGSALGGLSALLNEEDDADDEDDASEEEENRGNK